MQSGKLVILLVLISVLALPASAHTDAEMAEWERDWAERASVALTPKLIEERREFMARHPENYATVLQSQGQTFTPQRTDWGSGVEQWRPLVAGHFEPEDVSTALCLMRHESNGNPNAKNPRSTASGLFQILRFWWRDEFGLDPFVPEHNVWMARQIKDQQGWQAWSPYNRGLCR